MSPRLSVLLPYRDAAATLAEAIDSVLSAGDVDLELIAIDDGSRDEGPEVVRALAARHAAIVCVAAGGVGIAGALNHGLAAACAPLIGRMDADDVCLPGRFARQLAALEQDAALAVVGTQVVAFPTEEVGAGLGRYVAWQNALITPTDHRREIFIESPLCHPSVVMRRAALSQVGAWRDGPFPEDYDLWLRMDQAGCSFAKLPVVLLRWRHHPGRATFTDPRYAPDRFPLVKAGPLAARLRSLQRPFVIWGAGPEPIPRYVCQYALREWHCCHYRCSPF